MNKLVIVFAVGVAVIIASLYFSDPFVTAKPQSKFHFTKTVSSSPDPGIGQAGNQFVLLLSPNQGSIYDGSVTFTSTVPVEFVVLHELAKSDDKGQPTWSVDGNTVYAMSVIEPPTRANSFEFTGAAVAFRSKTPFTITASVDGWIRGQPTEVVIQQLKAVEKSFYLPDSHLSVTIPMRSGLFAKEPVYYIITDSSNQTLAERASLDWKVQFAPKLRWAPASSQDLLYVFTNGEKGDGIYGYQADVFASTPSQKDTYSPLRNLVLVSWKSGQKPQLLDSVDAILQAEKQSRIKLSPTNVTINAPQIVWPGGQMGVTNQTILDEFGKSQLVKIDKDSRKATFVAHRGWGADGRTLYYLITDATPAGPAEVLGVPAAPKLANTLSSNVFSDMYQFKNGIKGAGPLGFQQSVLSSKLDSNYIPVCRVSVVEWKDQVDASILETVSDINKKQSDGKIRVQLARPLSEDHVVNCPVIELPKSNKG
ncbi:MAG: hypothetical protein QW177_00600 [Candidatus Nitrosotenuis sp.]